MQYYSHVLHFPLGKKPFDKDAFRWPSFVGEFVIPLMKNRSDLYWFSYYTSFARFRVYTDDYGSLQAELEPLRDELGLVDKGEEKNETITGDLAKDRFIGPNTASKPLQRAEKLLASLHSVAKLVEDSITSLGDRYWAFEENGDKDQNPIGNHFFSITHLYHNMTLSDAQIYVFEERGKIDARSYYYYHDAIKRGHIHPAQSASFTLKL